MYNYWILRYIINFAQFFLLALFTMVTSLANAAAKAELPMLIPIHNDWDVLPDIFNKSLHMWQLAGVALLIIGIMLYWNRRLVQKITHRKQIEEQLRKLSRAIEQSHNTVIITDLNANIEFVNPAFTNVTGYTASEVIGKNPRILHSGYHNAAFYTTMWKELTQGRVWRGEMFNKSKTGKLYWENVTISSIKNNAGHTTHYVAIKENINLRKQAEQLAQEHLKRLNEAQRIAKIGSWYLTVADNSIIWSAQTYHIFGIKADIPIKLEDFLIRIHPADLELVLMRWQAAQAGKPYEIEYRIIVDKKIYWIVEQAELQLNTDGTVLSAIGTVQDITERKLMEHAIQKSQAQYQRLVDDIGPNFVIYSYRNDNVIEYVSKGCITVFGVEPSDIIGTTWNNAIAWEPDSLARGIELNEKFINREWDKAELEMEFTHPNGKLRTVAVTVHAVRNGDGKYIHSEGICEDITKRKQAENALRQSEERYRSLIVAMAEGLVLQELDGTIVTCNPAAERILGLTKAQIIGRSSLDASWQTIREDGSVFLNTDHPEMIALRTGQSVRNTIIGIHQPTGELVWILANSEPLFQPNATAPYAVVTTFTDITESKITQRELQEQRRMLQAVLENIPAGIQVFALDGKLMLSNQYAEKLLGRSPALETAINELNKVYNVFVHGTDILYPIDKMPLMRGLRGETSMVEDMELRRQDGVRILLQVIGAPIPGTNGNPYASVVIFRDITLRKKMERLQALNEARLDSLLELSRKAFTMSEEELLYTGQEEAERLTNSEISYMHFVNLDPKEIHLGFWSQATMAQCQTGTNYHESLSKAGIWANSIRQQRALICNDYQSLHEPQGYPEGHVHIRRFMSVPIVENGQVKMIIGVGNKATSYSEYDLRQLQLIAEDLWHIIIRRRAENELKVARQSAEAASHAKSTFIAHISHELRTPLTGILGFAQLLLMDKELNHRHREYVQTMQKSGEHLLGLINEILDLAKIGAGKLELNPVLVHLPSLLKEVIAMIKIRADNKGVQVNSEWHSLPETIQIDGLRLNQILLNLLGNAVKFTQRGEIKLWIRTQPTDTPNTLQLDFAVADTGPGIPAERIHQVMLPFERLANQASEGAGLGLSISNALIKKMGGEFNLGSQTAPGLWSSTNKSTAPISINSNHGTIAWFSLTLPIITSSMPASDSNANIIVDAHDNVMQLTATDIPNTELFVQACKFTEIGDVAGLHKLCNELQQDHLVFANCLRNYLDQFQLNELRLFLSNIENKIH